MRVNAVFRFDNTFDIYTPTATQDPITLAQIVEYVPVAIGVKGKVVPGSQGGIYLSTVLPLTPRDQVRNAVDRNNVPLFSVGDEQYIMYVNECVPAYDAFGSIVGFRSVLRRDYKKTIEERVAAAKEAATK